MALQAGYIGVGASPGATSPSPAALPGLHRQSWPDGDRTGALSAKTLPV